MSASEPSSPAARAWTSTLPSAVASTAPTTTSRPVTSAVSRHSSSLRTPPPIAWTHVIVAPGDGLEPLEHEAVLAGERDEDRARGLAAVARLALAGCARRPRRSAPACRRARGTRRRRGRTAGRRPGAASASRWTLGERQVPGARALLLEPQAHDVLQQPRRAVDAALVRQVRRARGVGQHGLGQLDAEQAPGAAGQDRGVLVAHRRGDERRGGVVAGDGEHRARRRARGAPARGRAACRARRAGRRGAWGGRAARRARAPRRRCAASSSPVVDAAVASLASSPESQNASRSGTSAMALGGGERARALVGEQLEDRVDRHRLDAGRRRRGRAAGTRAKARSIIPSVRRVAVVERQARARGRGRRAARSRRPRCRRRRPRAGRRRAGPRAPR